MRCRDYIIGAGALLFFSVETPSINYLNYNGKVYAQERKSLKEMWREDNPVKKFKKTLDRGWRDFDILTRERGGSKDNAAKDSAGKVLEHGVGIPGARHIIEGSDYLNNHSPRKVRRDFRKFNKRISRPRR